MLKHVDLENMQHGACSRKSPQDQKSSGGIRLKKYVRQDPREVLESVTCLQLASLLA